MPGGGGGSAAPSLATQMRDVRPARSPRLGAFGHHVVGLAQHPALLLAVALLACGYVGARDTDAEATYFSTTDKPKVEIFRISENMLIIPDWIEYNARLDPGRSAKKTKLFMEVVSGREKERYEPIAAFDLSLRLEDTTAAGLLQTRKRVLDTAFELACRTYDRGDAGNPRPADGFSVDFRDTPIGGYLLATVTLYDFDDTYREQVLNSISDLKTLVENSYAAQAKYMGDLSKVVGEYATLLAGIQTEVRAFNGHAAQLVGINARLSRVSDSLEALIVSIEDSRADGAARMSGTESRLGQSIAAGDQAIRADLSSIYSSVQQLNQK